jgi:hypothetical protein
MSVSLHNRTDNLTLCLSDWFRLGLGTKSEFKHSEFIDPAQIAAFLHYAGEKKVIAGKAEFKSWFAFSSGPGYTRIKNYVFPWGRNALEEAWVELRLPGQRYWLEIPYGFTRNPRDRLSPAIPSAGPPATAAAMEKLPSGDKILKWSRVRYPYARIQNSWSYELILSNPFDGRAEIVLYRDDCAVGMSMFLWNLDTPKTAVTIVEADGGAHTGLGMARVLHDDGMRRSDTFHFSRVPSDARDWGTIRVRIGDKEYKRMIPSSMYNYTHGHAVPESAPGT